MTLTEWDYYGAPPIHVIGDAYCLPCPMELTVKKKIKKLSHAQFDVFDQSGNLLLQAEGGLWNLSMTRTLRDPAGLPILTMRGKVLTLKHKWRACEGEGMEDNNMLFSVQQSHPLQIKKELNVFLANNHRKKFPDFRVVGSYISLSFKVFHGHRIIAEVTHNFTLESFCKGKEKYKVKVYPEVDYAFIVALLVILDENDTP